MIFHCHFCKQSNVDAPENVPFIHHDGIAICYLCIILAAVTLREYLAGELEYRSWLK